MNRAPLFVLALLLAGCMSGPDVAEDPAQAPDACSGGEHPMTLWLAPGLALVNETPAAGSVFSNGFDEAFLVDEMDEWHSSPAEQGMRITGNITIEFWARNHGTPAPIVTGGDPGEGYHWFNQFGTQRGFIESYGRDYAAAAPTPDSIDHYVQVLEAPAGGLHVEPGDHFRLLLTSLVVDDDNGRGQEILFGGETPSSVSFSYHCWLPLTWDPVGLSETDVSIPANQGLITGALGVRDGLNSVQVPMTVLPSTQRLTIQLRQSDDASPAKDDMDLTIVDAAGQDVVSIGSPYSDETGTFYAANLEAFLPAGDYQIRVDSYSGNAYTGTVTVIQERADLSVTAESAAP